MSEPLHPFSAAALPSSADPVAESAALYATEVAELLFNLLVDVVRERAPDAEAVLTGELSGLDLEVDTLQDLDGTEGLADVADRQRCHRRASYPLTAPAVSPRRKYLPATK